MSICKINPLKFYFILIYFTLTSHLYSQNQKIENITANIQKGYLDQRSLPLLADLYRTSKEYGSAKGQLYALYQTSEIYFELGKFEAALKNINEGIDIAKDNNDYNMLCRFSIVFQKILRERKQISESKQILAKAQEYNKKVDNKNDRDINSVYILLSEANLLTDNEGLSKQMDKVLPLKQQAYSQVLKLDESKEKEQAVIYTLESLAWSLALAEKLPEAREKTVIIDQLLKNYPNSNLVLQNLVIKGAIENITENYPPAISYISQAIAQAKNNGNSYKLYEIYPMISASYGELHDFENATKYSWKQKHLADSINSEYEKPASKNFFIKISNKILEKKSGLKSPFVFPVILASALLLVGILIFTRKKRLQKKSLQKDESLKPDPQTLQIEIDTTKNLVRLAKEDLNAFYIEFSKIYPNFYPYLKEKFPDLNIYDLNFCALVKMNFELKEISTITNSTVRSVESRRYRILKKMDLKSQNDLYMLVKSI